MRPVTFALALDVHTAFDEVRTAWTSGARSSRSHG